MNKMMLTAVAAAGLVSAAYAQPEIRWYTIDGGGGVSTGGTFQVSGTIGQPDTATLAGGTFEVRGGFWGGSGSSGPSCPADFNGDGFLDFFDYLDYVGCFEEGACPPGTTADFNRDDFVDFFDYSDFVSAFEVGC